MPLEFKVVRQLAATLAIFLAAGTTVSAQEAFKLAVGQRGNWDTSIAELGKRGGIFKKHGIELEILYTQGGGETQQAVISGSVDIGVAAGIMGVLSAYSKGAPVRILGNQTAGGTDLFWYVKADSAVKSLKDTAGKTIAYSTNGSSTHGIVVALVNENGLKARPTATGGPSATLTAVMSDQIDIGWSAPPFGLDLLEQGKIRVIASGNDANAFRNQTVRVLLTNVQTLKDRKPAIERFMAAYRETLDWMYASDEALKIYADFVGIPEARAKRTRDDFFPKAALNPDSVVGLDVILPEAVNLKYTAKQLTPEQISELMQIPPRK